MLKNVYGLGCDTKLLCSVRKKENVDDQGVPTGQRENIQNCRSHRDKYC